MINPAYLINISIYMLFLIFPQNNLYSQTKDNEKQHSNLAKYYNYTNNAELAICDKKFRKANRMYKRAFKKHNPFLTENYNACLSVIPTKNKKLFRHYFHQLIQKGITKTDLNKIIEYAKKNAPKLLDKKTIQIWENYDENKYGNKQFIEDIISVRNNDQLVREWSLNTTGEMYHESSMDSILLIDSINYYRVISIYEEYNYPLEINGISPWQSLAGEIVIGHNISHNRYWMDSLCIQKVQEGKIHARKAAYLLSRQGVTPNKNRKNYKFETPMQIGNVIYVPKLKPTEEYLQKITKLRHQLYLCNYEDYTKKMHFQLDNPIFCFMPASYFPRYSGIPDKIIKEKIIPYYTKKSIKK